MKEFKGKKDLKDISNRIRTMNFSGNTGTAIKNTIFSFSTTLTAKIGSLILTIILARLLLPELFGLYSLALSTIMIFVTLSDLGINQTLVKFLSSSKSEEKSKAYFNYLLKTKLILSTLSIIILLALARTLANNYYKKPIFLALVAGTPYILFSGLIALLDSPFQSKNNFKKGFHKEIIFQTLRLILVPLSILLLINKVSEEKLLFVIFIALGVSFFVASLYLIYSLKNEVSFLKLKDKGLNKKEKKKINKFVLALSALALSSVFFGFIDMFILGRYVEAEFLGFYRAAFSLITSAAPLITFSGALFPLFSRLSGKRLLKGFKKSIKLTLAISIPSSILTFIIAPLVVKIIYGNEYLPAISILKIFSCLIFLLPLTSVYSSFLISQNKPRKVANSLILATILNIILNYIFILYLLPYGQIQAVYGATFATIISKGFYLGLLVWKSELLDI